MKYSTDGHVQGVGHLTEEQHMKWILIIVLVLAVLFLAQKFMGGRR